MNVSHRRRFFLSIPIALGLLPAPAVSAQPTPVVNDVTGLNPVPVLRIERPAAVEDVQRVLRETRGPVSIGGGKFSMGGQVAHEGSIHLDMTGLHRILQVDGEKRTVRVQAGARWRDIQEALDPMDLSLRIMQTYANFTVGGSLSVNCHGRYIGEGPLIRSVRSIKVVLADGSLVQASPAIHPEIFYGAIGGYGGLGVIVEAELDLTNNGRIRRRARAMALADYPNWFKENIRGNPSVVFHNADLYPNGFDHVMAVSWESTDRPLTTGERLQRHGPTTAYERAKILLVSEVPFMKDFRRLFFDPWTYRGEVVVPRNLEASYDVAELEPASRDATTYVLQEYFVPAHGLTNFIPRMARTFKTHGVNVLNVSIRHAWGDPGSTLAWARGETFALVVYYKQGTSPAHREAVGIWTRELIEEVLACGGTYYLPYQPHATRRQFLAAYPQAPVFFALKQKLDPQYRFRNKLWDAYHRPDLPPDHLTRKDLRVKPGYLRREDQGFLTLPEWYIVFSYEEFARWVQDRPPSAFPYFRSIGQSWTLYGDARKSVEKRYPWNGAAHLMNAVIGASFSVEYALKGLYESTVGRFSEWTAGGDLGDPEDRFLARTAAEYLAFVRERPWYEFSFTERLTPLWGCSREGGRHGFRRAERRLSASGEFLVKALWAQLITWGSRTAFETESQTTGVLVEGKGPMIPQGAIPVENQEYLLTLPRYGAFTAAAAGLLSNGVRFKEICGNGRVMATFRAPSSWQPGPGMVQVTRWPILTQPGLTRVALDMEVESLGSVIGKLAEQGGVLDHLFDD